MQLNKTERGFMRGEFIDLYGSQCSIQESSLATEMALWLGVDTNFKGEEQTRMHLSIEQVKELIPILQEFIETGEIGMKENNGHPSED